MKQRINLLAMASAAQIIDLELFISQCSSFIELSLIVFSDYKSQNRISHFNRGAELSILGDNFARACLHCFASCRMLANCLSQVVDVSIGFGE